MNTRSRRPTRQTGAGEVVPELRDGLRKQRTARERGEILQRFEFAAQNRFRGPEDDVRQRLSIHLPRIQELAPQQLAWIDLGCGRGEWLGIAMDAGASITGVDRNQFAVEQCLARQLPAVQEDAFEYLRKIKDETCAVVTAFHLLENCKFDYILELLSEVVRVLAPSGVFGLETPNAANPRVRDYQFWLDPMHSRLLPSELMAFTLEQVGLRVVYSGELNPDSQYGAADYAILAVR